MSLSRDWRPVSSHESFYTGGAITWHEATKSIFGLASECVIMYRDGHVVGKLEEEGDGILTFAVNPNGSAVITSHRSTLLRHWEVVGGLGSGSSVPSESALPPEEEGNSKKNNERSKQEIGRTMKWRAIKSWKGHETGIVSDLSFDSKGHFFASGGLDKVAKVWDFDGRFVTHNFHGHESMITHVRFHPRKLHLISISEDAEIRIWDLHRNGCLASLKDHMSKISSLDFHTCHKDDGAEEEDNVFMVTGGRDAIVNVWNLNECKLQTMIPAFESVEGVVCFASEQREFNILTVGDKGILQVWDGRSRKKVEHAMSPHGLKGAIRRAFKARYRKQDVLVTIGEDRHMIMWTLDLRMVARFMTHCDSIVTCQFAGPEHALVVVNDETPFLMRVDDFRIDAVLQGHREPILAADTRKEDNTVCTGGKDHEIRVWNGRGETKFLLKGHAGDVTSVLFPQKRSDLILSGSADKTIKLWVLPDKKEKKKGTEKKQQKETHATEGSSGAVIVDMAKITRVAHTKDVTCLAMAPNDKLCASGSLDKVIKIFTFPELEVQGECSGHRRGIWSVQFSARDKVLLSASGDGTVRLWNLADYSAIKAFEGHTGAVLQAHFLPNNMQIMSAGSDGLLKLWNIRTTDCVKSFEKHQDKVWGLHLHDEGRGDGGGQHRMLSGGDALILWEDCTEEVTNEEEALAADRMIKDAQIASCLQKKNYASALTLALELGKLGQLKSAIETWAMEGMTKKSFGKKGEEEEEEAKKEEGEDENVMMATSMMKDWVVSLTPELREKLVKDVLVKWITNRRTAQMANVLLRYCLPLIDVKMEGFNLVTDAFAAYGDRHLQRWDQICQQTFLVDLLLQSTFQTLPQAAVDTARVLFENADLSPRTAGASAGRGLTSAWKEGGKGTHQKGDAAQQSGGSGRKKKNKKNASDAGEEGEGKALVFEAVVVQEEKEEGKSDDRVFNDAPKKKRKKRQSKCTTSDAEEEGKKRVTGEKALKASGRVQKEENKENEKVGDADNNNVTTIIWSDGKTSDEKTKKRKRKRSREETEDGTSVDNSMSKKKNEEVEGKPGVVLVESGAQEELDGRSNIGRKKKKAKVEEAEQDEVEKKAEEIVNSSSTSMKKRKRKKKSKVDKAAKQEVEKKSEEKDQVNTSMKKKKTKNKK